MNGLDGYDLVLYEALMRSAYGPVERRFIPEHHRANADAFAIFEGIQLAFENGMGGNVMGDSYLVHNLAACASVALNHNKSESLPLDRSDHDYILIKAVRGLMRSIVVAVRNGHCKPSRHDGKYRIGGLVLPDELIEHTKSWKW